MTHYHHINTDTMKVYTGIYHQFLAVLGGVTSGSVLTYMMYDVRMQNMKQHHITEIANLKKKYDK